jgi:hypothetical protein
MSDFADQLKYGTNAPQPFLESDIEQAPGHLASRRGNGVVAAHPSYYDQSIVRFNDSDQPYKWAQDGSIDVGPEHWDEWNIVEAPGHIYVERATTKKLEKDAIAHNPTQLIGAALTQLELVSWDSEEIAHHLRVLGIRPFHEEFGSIDYDFARNVRIEESRVAISPTDRTITVHTPTKQLDNKLYADDRALMGAQSAGALYSVQFSENQPPKAIGLTTQLGYEASAIPVLQARYLRRYVNGAVDLEKRSSASSPSPFQRLLGRLSIPRR